MPNGVDEYSDSPYAWDWSAGAFAPPGVIWLGEIPLDRARELVDAGWQVIGQPLPPPAPPSGQPLPPPAPPSGQPLPPPAPTSGPEPLTPSDEGGPEESGPPTDFDTRPPVAPPPPTEPVNQPPVSVQPPIEGEHIPADEPPPAAPREGAVIEGEYDRFDRYPNRPTIPGSPPIPRGKRVRRIKNVPPRGPAPPPAVPEPPLPAPTERDIERVITRGIGRIVLGPIGSVLGPILVPTDLDSGSLPFPPVPRVSIPEPQPSLPEPALPPLPEPAPPELARPEVPDVVEVSAPAPSPLPAPRSRVPTPGRVPARGLREFLGGLLLGVLAPRLRRKRGPEPGFASNFAQFPEPTMQPEPATPPAPTTVATPEPLTPQEPAPVSLPLPGDAGTPFAPQLEQEDQCRCQKCKKCRRNKKRAQKLSNKLAHIEAFQRRISVYSLRNLRRGGIQQHLKRKL